MKEFSDLPIYSFRLYYKAQETIYLPSYPGATFRGAFGQTFNREVCVLPKENCDPVCPLGNQCAYNYIFTTPNDGTLTWFDKSTPTAPRPYILSPVANTRQEIRRDELFCFDLTLIGNSLKYLPYLVHVFERTGQINGIGKNTKNQYGISVLEKVVQFINNQPANTVYENETIHLNRIIHTQPHIQNDNLQFSKLRMIFLTPTRIGKKKKLIELTPNMQLSFQVILERLIKRIYLLYYFHHSREIPDIVLPNVEDIVTLQKSLQWSDWERRSINSHRKITTNGGFVGTTTFQGNWQKYFSILKLGEKVHLGNMTTFGLGKYIALPVE